jgi:hypothetical protein
MKRDQGFAIGFEDISLPSGYDESTAGRAEEFPALRTVPEGGFLRRLLGEEGPLSNPWSTLVVVVLVVLVWLASVDHQLRAGYLIGRIDRETGRGERILEEQSTALAGLKSMENLLAEAEREWNLQIPEPARAWRSSEGFSKWPSEIEGLFTGNAIETPNQGVDTHLARLDDTQVRPDRREMASIGPGTVIKTPETPVLLAENRSGRFKAEGNRSEALAVFFEGED